MTVAEYTCEAERLATMSAESDDHIYWPETGEYLHRDSDSNLTVFYMNDGSRYYVSRGIERVRVFWSKP